MDQNLPGWNTRFSGTERGAGFASELDLYAASTSSIDTLPFAASKKEPPFSIQDPQIASVERRVAPGMERSVGLIPDSHHTIGVRRGEERVWTWKVLCIEMVLGSCRLVGSSLWLQTRALNAHEGLGGL